MELLHAVLRWVGLRDADPIPTEPYQTVEVGDVALTAGSLVVHVGELRIESPDGMRCQVYLDGKELHGLTDLELKFSMDDVARARLGLLPCRMKSPLV